MADADQELVDYDEDTGDITEQAAAAATGAAKEQKKGSYVGIHATSFRDFLLRPDLMKAIGDCAFEHPSEVQQQCIPQAMVGTDILCQAKSGMGKTAVFVLATLQQVDATEIESSKNVVALVLAHTRELAYQIQNEFVRFAKYMPHVRIAVFYGGQPIAENLNTLKTQKPNVVVGTPGRIKQLVNEKHLNIASLKFFILDECDNILEKLDMRKDVQDIFRASPHSKQVMMFTATLSKEMKPICKKFMHNPLEITIDNETKLTLHGLQQYYVTLKEEEKNRKLVDLLDALDFNQVVIFVKSVKRAQVLTQLLEECNFPAICIHSALDQAERINRYRAFKNFEKRIMVATDLFGRGIDIERVNIVINYDMPTNSDSYLHRVGRAGRFGTKGLAITFVNQGEDDVKMIEQIQQRFEVELKELPDQIDTSSYMNN